MIDTHCHLTDPRLLEQIDAVLQRAADAGVRRMVTVGTSPDDWEAALRLAHAHSQISCAVGVHPNECASVDFNQIQRLRQLHLEPSVVALGEMGLDYFHKFAPRNLQEKFLRAQLEIARELDRPVIIHSREAVDDCLAILREYSPVQAVFHCFTGTVPEARAILDAGFLLGFTGVVTFKNAEALRSICAFMPADRVLVETDSPYLSPEPMRKQKINEPALVMHTAAVVARARGMTLEAFDELSTANAMRFYRMKV